MTLPWSQLGEILQQHETFLLTTHMRPDCDALGSQLAMAHLIRSLGKKARIVNGDAVPPHIGFLDPEKRIQSLEANPQLADTQDVDVIVILDTSAWSQLGPMADVIRSSSARRVLIDHHVSGDDLQADQFKDTSAEATGRLVLEAIEALEVPLTPEVATSLFTAIATDTGWFLFSSVTARTFAAASRLVEAGADPTAIFAALYEQHSFARLQLQGRILTAAKTELAGRLIFSCVSLADLAETGAEATDTEDVVNRLLTVRGVEVALLLLELESRKIKVSFRSRSQFDVRAIAEKFDGGGHTAAAGARFAGSLAEAEVAVVDAVRKAMG